MADERIIPSNHPAVRGREAELAALADEVRRLIALTVTNTADGAETSAITADLAAAADRLSEHVPDPVLPRFYTGESPDGPFDATPYDPVTGRYNPLAIPLVMKQRPPKAIGTITFETPYEGPPGCVHGAVLAGAFDMVLTAANQLEDAAGPTIELTLRFRKPTLLHTATRFEGWIEQRRGRVTTAAGHAIQGDVVTVEAIGKFISLSRDEVHNLANRNTA